MELKAMDLAMIVFDLVRSVQSLYHRDNQSFDWNKANKS